jgi:hypothetical protein
METFEVLKALILTRLQEMADSGNLGEEAEDYDRGREAGLKTALTDIDRTFIRGHRDSTQRKVHASFLLGQLESSFYRFGSSGPDAKTLAYMAFELFFELGVIDFSRVEMDIVGPDGLRKAEAETISNAPSAH